MNPDPTRPPPLLDMAPDGSFRDTSRARASGTRTPGTGAPLSFKLLLGATIVAVLAGAAAIAALALWFVALLLPVVVVAAGVAWITLKYRRWRRGTPATRQSLYPR